MVCLFLLVAIPGDADACGNVPRLQQIRSEGVWGYAALARLRGERAQAAGWMGWAMTAAERVLAGDARARCRSMARRPRICEA